MIVGRPNVGIVESIGTCYYEESHRNGYRWNVTRDTIEEYVNVRGVPLNRLIRREFVERMALLNESVERAAKR